MPGLNERGPENMGPMKGRRMGRCVAGNAYPDQNYAPGYGQGYGYGAVYSRGRGCGRGFGSRGRGSTLAGPIPSPTKDDLNLRAKALEQELEAVRNELKNLSYE